MRILILWTGAAGGAENQIADHLASLLPPTDVQVSHDVAVLSTQLEPYDAVVPVFAPESVSELEVAPLIDAVANDGLGIAGCYGFCSSVSDIPLWVLLAGGKAVPFPAPVPQELPLNVFRAHPITDDMPDDLSAKDPSYFLVDPAVTALVIARYPSEPTFGVGYAELPEVWIKAYGSGRVFHSGLGNSLAALQESNSSQFMLRGITWAARAT